MGIKRKKFALVYTDESKLIEFLINKLKGRLFDFSYKLADMGGKPILVSNQKLSKDIYDPVKFEVRGVDSRQSKVLVIMVEDPDDLLISIGGWRKPLNVDLSEEDTGKITISNADEDVYILQIHNYNKE